MKKKEIIKFGLKEYENALKKIKKSRMSYIASLNFLEREHLENGFCYFIEKRRLVNSAENIKWIKKHLITNSNGDQGFFVIPTYWGKAPIRALNRAEVIEALLLRRDILKEELKTCK